MTETAASFSSSPIVWLTAFSLLVVLVVCVYALLCWHQRNMSHFAYMVVAITINVLGYYLEVTATSLDAALVACRVSYIGAPLTGILLFLFSLDYSSRIRLNKVLLHISLSLAPLFTLAVYLYPWVPIFYRDLTFNADGLVPHLVVTPGPLYWPCIIYASLFTVLGFINLMVSFVQQKHYEGMSLFVLAIVVPFLAQLYIIIFGLIDGWNPLRTALALSTALLAVFLARYKQAEWQSTGRELVVQQMDDAFILLDNKDMVIDHNLSAERYFPILKEKQRHLTAKELWGDAREGFLTYGTLQYDTTVDGATVNFKVTSSPLLAGNKATGKLVIINDNTGTNKIMQELTRMARIDELTGLNNRATFFHDAQRSFDQAMRQVNSNGSALMMDIDYFKNVNDTYGHAMGDEVLVYMGCLLSSRFRHTDISGRYGGEELIVWMPGTTLAGAKQVAEELRSRIEAQTFQCEDSSFSVTVSIGIATIQDSSPKNFEDLIKKADYALYEAKKTGRNRVCVCSNDTMCSST